MRIHITFHGILDVIMKFRPKCLDWYIKLRNVLKYLFRIDVIKEDILAFLARLKNEKLVEVSPWIMYMIEVNLSTIDPSSWVLDTGCGSRSCNGMKVLETSRRLTKGEVLRVRNGAKVVASAVGTIIIPLPSGLILELRDCYYVPSISQNIIFVSYLALYDDMEFCIKGNCCSFSKLGHINETRLTKLHKQGYIDPFNYESYGTYVSGPMNTSARGGYSYFITFTDDHSHYGYVYLMKYKSESFDKFKEYRAEVEKQTGKSILTLRSDREGEYLSQEFQDYLKENGILA
ncbi:Integrase [Theobroma cacao]|nr:Integrase [Theobroma cacao]